MPRYDDRHANTRLYVGHLASRTRSRDLEYVFSKYGRVRDVDMKRDYAFVEFSDPRDADDARYHLDGKDLDGSRIIVEFAKGVPRGSREYVGRGPPPGSGRCFNCGIDGHWARDCKAGDWKNKCYRCGERGHIERNCKNSPKKLSGRGRSYSRSPSPRRGRSRSPSYSRGRSYSRSRSPPPKRERSIENEDRSPSRELNNGVSSKGRKRSLSPDEVSLRPSSKSRKLDDQQDRSDYSGSPRRSRSPARKSPEDGRYRSPAQTNGRTSSRSRSHSHSRGRSRTRSRSRSPIPIARDDRSPDDYEDNRHSLVRSRSRSPRGSESP